MPQIGPRAPCVLVVDGVPAIRLLVKSILEPHGYFVLLAEDGPRALELLHDHVTDVILTDLAMHGMSGQELIAVARRHHPDIAACVMTGDLTEVSSAAGFPILLKPFAARDLVETVQRMLCPVTVRIEQLRQEKDDARTHWLGLKSKLDEILAEGPRAIPNPDGLLRMELAGRAALTAYAKYLDACDRYTAALTLRRQQ